MLRDIQATLTSCQAVLAGRGTRGAFVAAPLGVTVKVTWTSRWGGDPRVTAEALREAEVELQRAGFDAVWVRGLGVVVQGRAMEQVVDARCGEGAVHNVDPDPSTERECELTDNLANAAQAALGKGIAARAAVGG